MKNDPDSAKGARLVVLHDRDTADASPVATRARALIPEDYTSEIRPDQLVAGDARKRPSARTSGLLHQCAPAIRVRSESTPLPAGELGHRCGVLKTNPDGQTPPRELIDPIPRQQMPLTPLNCTYLSETSKTLERLER